MKKISYWAHSHKWTSRIIIIAIYLLLNLVGIVTGVLLQKSGFLFPTYSMGLFSLILLTGLFLYPAKEEKHKRLSAIRFYLRQKSCDLLLAGATFCMIVFIANHSTVYSAVYATATGASTHPISTPKDSVIKNYRSIPAFAASMKNSEGKSLTFKAKKKLLKAQIKAIKKANDLSNGEKTLLIILSIIVALGLLYLVAALSCTLSCSGAEGLAIFVGIAGTAVVIFLLFLVIRSIVRKHRSEPKKQENQSTN